MVSVRQVQASFVSGELDSTMFGRVDTDIIQKSAAELRNVYVRPQGGVFRREGLEYVNASTDDKPVRLIPFEFNDSQSYILACQGTASSSGEINVYKTDSNTVQDTLTISLGGGLWNMSEEIIKEMRWAQSADTLYIVHPTVQPLVINRINDTTWTANLATLSNLPPFAFSGIGTSNPAGTITPDVVSGQVVITGSGTNFTAGAYEGQFINFPKGGRVLVKTVNSTTSLEGYVRIELASTSAVTSGNWELESGYSDVMNSTNGWPRSVAFYKGRLWFGGTNDLPAQIVASKVGQFTDFDIGEGLDDEAISVSLQDNNQIRDLFPGRGLQIFTSGSEYTIRSEVNDAVTPANISDQLRKETLHGSGPQEESISGSEWPMPTSVDGATIFVETKGGVVRQFVFNDTEQSFNATNISILSQTIIGTPVSMDIRRAVTSQPSDYLYIINSDGNCAVLNSLREQDLLAWSLFTTEGTFEDVAVSGREVYFSIKRTINGVEKRYIEKLNPNLKLDASERQDNGSPTTTWNNFDHLEAETVKLIGDDKILADKTVSSGSFTTDEEVSVLEAGINFLSKIKGMPVETIIQGQSFAGQLRALAWANIRLYQTRNCVVQYKGKTYSQSFNGLLDTDTDTYSGWKKYYLGGHDRDPQITITQDQPLDFNVLNIVYGVKL